jgi:hypothetical protein
VADPREIHQIEYRWHPVRDLCPIASSMSPDSTRGWDSRIRAWVRHPAAEAPVESVCYQLLPPNGSLAALAFRYRMRAGGDTGVEGRPLVSRVLVGSASLLTPEVAIALCWAGLPSLAGERPGLVAAGAELESLSADDLAALSMQVAGELDDEAAWTDGLAQVVAVALADPGAPLAVVAGDGRILGPAAEIAPLLWGLCAIIRPLLGTVRRGWSFSTFEPPLDSVDSAVLPDIVFREAADAVPVPSATPRREARVRLGDPDSDPDSGPDGFRYQAGSGSRAGVEGLVGFEGHGGPARPGNSSERSGLSEHDELAGTAQAWLADWLVAEYRAGGGDAIARLIAECAVEQPLQARLAAIYDLLHAKWADKHLESPRSPEPAPDLGLPTSPDASAEASPEPATADAPGEEQPEASPEAAWEPDADQDSPFSELDDYEPPAYQASARQFPEPGSLGPFPREGTPPPLPLRQQGPHQRAWEQRAGTQAAWGQEAWGRGAWEHSWPGPDHQPPLARPQPASMPELLTRLAGTQDADDFKSVLQEVLTLGGVPEFGDRVEARRLLTEVSWCIHPSRPSDRELHADELSRIFQLIVNPDLGRPRVAREIADWATVAPPAVIRGLLAGAKAGDRSADDACYSLMMKILEPVLAGRWIDEHELQADWHPRRPRRPRHEPGLRALRPFRKRP